MSIPDFHFSVFWLTNIKKRVKEPYCMFLDFDQNCFLNLFVIYFTEPNSPKVPSSEKSGVPLSSGSETVADS